MKRLRLVMVIGLVAACADEVPESPSFQIDVAPILQANCARCHLAGSLATVGKFRLTYSTLPFPELSAPDGDPLRGAGEYAVDIARVVANGMHPRRPLDDDQIETIARWYARGAQRGSPRPGNREPVVTIVESTGNTVAIDIHDPDGDLVGGYLTENGTTTTEVIQGRNVITLLPGNRALSLHLDDGGAESDVDLGVLP